MKDPQAHSAPAPGNSRREFLRNIALVAGAASLAGAANAAALPTEPEGESPPSEYLSFGPDEAAFVEALVDVMCPADGLTPRGVECGLALFVDRQLAGAFGQGERLYRNGPWRPGRAEDGFQRPLTPEQFYKAGIAAANEACRRRHGRPFAALDHGEADEMLTVFAAGGTADEPALLGEWFNELVYPLFVQSCFADPIYGGNRGKVFWKMLGYPGLPAVNGLNMVRYRGKPFPGARTPMSMEDFS
ncbi:MAG: gluconate 2-dehydrogenase subunit 3 family protein [Opitutaceae bacterium]